jgi:hypothetical protein
MLKGRLGLETARIPHVDRHGLLGLGRGRLTVEDGTVRFITAGDGEMKAGDYAIPFQGVSCILLGPGSTVSHDALRLLARHGTGLLETAYREGELDLTSLILLRNQLLDAEVGYWEAWLARRSSFARLEAAVGSADFE